MEAICLNLLCDSDLCHNSVAPVGRASSASIMAHELKLSKRLFKASKDCSVISFAFHLNLFAAWLITFQKLANLASICWYFFHQVGHEPQNCVWDVAISSAINVQHEAGQLKHASWPVSKQCLLNTEFLLIAKLNLILIVSVVTITSSGGPWNFSEHGTLNLHVHI